MKLTKKDKAVLKIATLHTKTIANILNTIPENIRPTLYRLRDFGLIKKRKDNYVFTAKGLHEIKHR